MTGWRIVCDVGGTNIRIARSEGPKQLVDVRVQPTGLCPSVLEAILDYCHTFDDTGGFEGAAIACAGPVESGRVTLTNGQMTIDRQAMIAGLGGRPVALLNDLEATAYAIPLLSAGDTHAVVPASQSVVGPYLVVNVGTGFGAALLFQTPVGWQSVATEAGHMTLGITDLKYHSDSELVSVEDRLSGLAVCAATKQPFASETFVEEFGEIFGAVCGNLVLATGAWGGLYLCGSVASAWCRARNFAPFIASFRNKGRMSEKMARIGISEIALPHPALNGLTTIKLS
jgi:glucokinase